MKQFAPADRGAKNMPISDHKLSTTEKFAYGIGDAAANFVFQTQITFLMFFYTNVFGIAAGVAGTILLVSRVIDACNDPIVGALADRTHTRWGHFRPWVLWTAVPMAIALVLCYTTPQLSNSAKIIWAVATYNVLMVIYAANNIPYCALSGVMTADSHERTSLASWRFVCAMAAALVVNMFTLDLVEYFGRGNAALGYQLTMTVWGALVVVFFVITFVFTKERIAPDPRQRSSVRQDLSDLFQSGPWITLFTLAVLIYVELALCGSAMLYYFKYYMHVERIFSWIDNFGLFNGVGLAFTIVGVVLSKPLAERFGKRATFRVCLFLSAVFMAAYAIVPPDSFTALLLLQVLLQLSFGPTIPILWAMMADVADYSEWLTRRRSTALAFASIVFGLKLGFGIGGWLSGELLEYFGYSATAPLSPSASRGIVTMVSLIPSSALFLGVGVLYCYRLDDQLMDEIQQTLAARRKTLDVASTTPAHRATKRSIGVNALKSLITNPYPSRELLLMNIRRTKSTPQLYAIAAVAFSLIFALHAEVYAQSDATVTRPTNSDQRRWLGRDLSIDRRVSQLIEEMTLEEKIGQLWQVNGVGDEITDIADRRAARVTCLTSVFAKVMSARSSMKLIRQQSIHCKVSPCKKVGSECR